MQDLTRRQTCGHSFHPGDAISSRQSQSTIQRKKKNWIPKMFQAKNSKTVKHSSKDTK